MCFLLRIDHTNNGNYNDYYSSVHTNAQYNSVYYKAQFTSHRQLSDYDPMSTDSACSIAENKLGQTPDTEKGNILI